MRPCRFCWPHDLTTFVWAIPSRSLSTWVIDRTSTVPPGIFEDCHSTGLPPATSPDVAEDIRVTVPKTPFSTAP